MLSFNNELKGPEHLHVCDSLNKYHSDAKGSMSQIGSIFYVVRDIHRSYKTTFCFDADEKSRLKSFNFKINENLFDETNTSYIKELTYAYQYDANDRLVQVSVANPNFKKIKIDEKLWQINYDSHGKSLLEE